ncbi:MAG: protease modulator HflK [Verrucomicrobiae bacterium]|nr:protease modulator HflK [Verrucomicrobiae bacterium]
MDRNIQRTGLLNLLALLAVAAAGFAVARHDGSLAGQVTALFLGVGTLVALVSWFQMRLETNERLERIELEEMARAKGSAALFETTEVELFPAARARQQFEKWFVPIFSILLLVLQGGGAVLAWRELAGLPAPPPMRQELLALSLFGLFALVLFLLGRFSATLARLEDHRLLRPGANWLLLGAYLCLLTALGIAAVRTEFPRADLYLARGLCVLLGLLALETLLNLVLEIYRPRVKGQVARPLYENRVVGVLAQPETLVTTAAQALDYQFGFKVSETWFYRFFERALGWLLLLQLGVLLLATCFVVIEPGEQALLERFGRPVPGREVLEPGLHLKWPWPLDRVHRVRTAEIHTLHIGFEPEEHKEHAEERTVVWTIPHGKEDNFIVANRETPRAETPEPTGRKVPPVSLVTVNIPVQYRIRSLRDWAYRHEDANALLQQVATREIVRYLVSADLNEIMSRARLEAARALRQRIQRAADQFQLGVEILFVGLQGIHPPVKVAPEYEKVVGARHKKEAKILEARAHEIRTNTLAAAQSFALTNRAEADRLQLEQTALARAAAFTNQLPAFRAAPSVYQQRAYAQMFAAATAPARKYILLTTNTQDVITYDLQQRLDEEYFQRISAAVKPPTKP